MEIVKLVKFNFDRTLIQNLRNLSSKDWRYLHKINLPDESVSIWNKYTSSIIRIDETLEYINICKYGDPLSKKQAFDFYELILHCDVVISCIKGIANIFKVNYEYIENSFNCFSGVIYDNAGIINKLCDIPLKNEEKTGDKEFWAYLRSVTTVHPVDTSRATFFDNNDKNSLHTSPFVLWNFDEKISKLKEIYNKNLTIRIAKGEQDSVYSHIYLDTSMIEKYMNKWIKLLSKIDDEIEPHRNSKTKRFKTKFQK